MNFCSRFPLQVLAPPASGLAGFSLQSGSLWAVDYELGSLSIIFLPQIVADKYSAD